MLIAIAAVCVPNLARAQDDFYRGGCYLGAAGTVAFPASLENELEIESGSGADVDESLGLHARVGCRTAWGGGELHFEWLEEFNGEAGGRKFKGDGWALTLDGKVYPLWLLRDRLPPLARRFQPFGTIGFGYLTADGTLDATEEDPAWKLDDWDFAARFGGGLDVYLTQRIAISVDTTYVLPVSNALEEMDYLSIGWGILFHF